MTQYIIGREGNQPFTITDDYVSRRHASFTYDEATGMMTLTNLSKSGTFIKMGNHFQGIEQCPVNATTIVRLGPNYIFSIGQLFKPVQPSAGVPAGGGARVAVGVGAKPPEPKPRVDISKLRYVAESYEATKLKLDQAQATNGSIRMLSIGGTLLGGTLGGLLGDNTASKVVAAGIAIMFLICLLIYCSKNGRKIIVQKNENEKKYKIAYCCPKCHASLAGKLYENILAEGKCPKCKTEYYDSKA